MKTLLVIAKQAGLAEAIRAVLDPEKHRVIHQKEAWEADPLLNEGTIDVCVLDADLTNIQPIRLIEKLRRRMPQCPIVVYTNNKQWEWEEEAYLLGVSQILTKPVRARLLNALLERIWASLLYSAERGAPASKTTADTRQAEAPHGAAETLEVLRDFSEILSHSLSGEALLKKFLLMLREILGINRAAIFLRPPPAAADIPRGDEEESRRLRSSCAIGLPPGLLDHFQLSLVTGIGGYVFRRGRILRRDSPEAEADADVRKEFELLGAQVAIPILDRETLIGVAIFDGRVTGEPIVNAELELVFHLFEELGISVKNIWRHDQLGARHEMMGNILRHLHTACVVVGRDMSILHNNDTACTFFGRSPREKVLLEFSDLPQPIGSKVFEVLKSGKAAPPFKYRAINAPDQVYQVTITPFRKEDQLRAEAALLVVEDFAQTEKLQTLEIETANLRLIKTIAERMAHEIGNSLVPISTHQQLLATRFNDPDFRASLDAALADGVKRVSRLVNQLLFLSKDTLRSVDNIPLAQLIEDAFRDAQKQQPGKSSLLKVENSLPAVTLMGDRASLKHALAEVILNALQANPPDPQVSVRTNTETDPAGHQWVTIEVKDSGKGFTPEAQQKVPEPFFTTRNVGLGLGLTVTRKIVETHKGKLEILSSGETHAGVVRISLPLENGQSENGTQAKGTEGFPSHKQAPH
jgi:signal transduction histidine kinase/DNA-binding NarL/FixJ family response regulator